MHRLEAAEAVAAGPDAIAPDAVPDLPAGLVQEPLVGVGEGDRSLCEITWETPPSA